LAFDPIKMVLHSNGSCIIALCDRAREGPLMAALLKEIRVVSLVVQSLGNHINRT